MGIDFSFWNNKKVLITGHTGFKGAWLSFWLNRMGANVKGVALEPHTKPSLYSSIILEDYLESKYGDVRDLEFLKREFKNFNPEIVIHLAAQSLVRESYDNPIETFETNVIGTGNVLEASKEANNINVILCVTSDKCYENKEWPWKYRESDALGGWDPYSASKGCSELVISSYRKSFFNINSYEKHGTAIASARAGNVIGGGDWASDRLVPDIIRSFVNENPVIIRNPGAIRPWQHVFDVLRGYLMLAQKLYESGPEFGEAWNFGPASEGDKTVRNIVDKLTDMWGEGASWKSDNEEHPHEAFTLSLDSSKVRSRIGWESILSFEQGLEFVVDWYKQFYINKEEAYAICDEQIARYEEICKEKTGVI